MKTYILDTSVVIKWFNQEREEHIDKASKIYQDFIDGRINIIIPNLLLLELINVLRIGKKLTKAEIKEIVNIIYRLPVTIEHPTQTVLIKTIEIAEKNNITAYDGLFLALAEAEDCQLISDDRKAHGKIRDEKVLMLSDYKPS